MLNSAAKSGLAVPAEIGRRAVLVGAAAALAAPAAAQSMASPLDELIADYQMAAEEQEALAAEADRLTETVELPKVAVRYGRRRLRDPETGEEGWGQWIFASAFEADRHFDSVLRSWPSCRQERIPQLQAERDAVMAELRKQEARRASVMRSSGMTAAEHLADQALFRMLDIRREIFAHQPTTMAEVATKNTFLLRQVRDGINLQHDLELILGGTGSRPHKDFESHHDTLNLTPPAD